MDQEIYAAAKPHLLGLLEVIREPSSVTSEFVSEACSALGQWFEARGHLRCAVDFALAAYFAVPRSAGHAARVGRLLRMLAEYPRSISWYDYAIYVARQSRDWLAYTEALAGLGNLHFQIGNLPRARHFHRRCLRTASRSHLPEMVGGAYHNLFVLEMDAGNIELAETFAQKAFATYGPSSPYLVRLARDLSRRWTVLGHFERSLPLACETLHHFSAPVDLALVWADIARAAGGAGRRAEFEDAWAEAWVLVKRGVAVSVAADVLIDLARGAGSLAELPRAAHAASRALAIASERKEGRTILEAEALIESFHLPKQNGLPLTTTAPEPELGGDILRALRELRAVAA
ncbi:MAG TPA: hypothetical protein VFE05_10390 [Longimicrobiaceae bacterium]|nr:hypothetical protein [Longimicrobiaceae bacterium]